ncbi:MAG: class I mannose-6-phosphate isomerase [Candidatus Ornithospirochaeta sp.]|nr:class I mannose-6-phosphate isomerase [Sphaerochaetaceae bacterium]MDY5523301.1 class I mannose-6-phosphate isomerase [Candidatus Ornithospirochaeta sp.]
MSSYDRKPTKVIPIKNGEAYCGWEAISNTLKTKLSGDKWTLVVECYPGTDEKAMEELVSSFAPKSVIRTKDLLKDQETLNTLLRPILTDDRVFGRMYYGTLEDFWDSAKVTVAKEQVATAEETVLVIGFGASLIASGDLNLLLDINRWEIQLRYRKGMSNYFTDNPQEDTLRKYKQGYFLEWRIADKVKYDAFFWMDYFVDMNITEKPSMISRDLFHQALEKDANEPFRVVPYFDPGVWGGQWMKDKCNLDSNMSNYAWSFDGVPEEDSLRFLFGDVTVEMPAQNLVLLKPKAVLGEKPYARFGAEFPIRFDFLDTIDGQNLSLQVHPVTEYIHKNFGMSYTQDESYYILDAKEDACVYLGLTEDCHLPTMIEELEAANRGEKLFEAEKYINVFPAKKHDHFLIPAGTCHCSGRNAMVLEISATPYIFTFKLWDWGRLGLDGKPRPVHINHGKHVIQDYRRTEWVKENLVNVTKVIEENNSYKEEHTGLHGLEFIETRRFTISKEAEISCHESVNVLNLVEGETCIVQSIDGSFSDFKVHYAETFIIPASVGKYRLVADQGEVKVLQAYVRC